MPSRDIFNYTLSKIESLDINLIAPQHGSIIEKKRIAPLIAQMKKLECGLYIEDGYHDKLIYTIEELKKKDLALLESLSRLKEREELLFQKAKMADMGEMIGNIAHQWRQPLALNNTLISILKEKNQREILQPEELAIKLNEMENSIQYMSRTIDDFMSFYHPNKRKVNFLASEAVNRTLEIIRPLLNKSNIEIHLNIVSEPYINGYMNEYAQVLVSILNNAKDVLIQRKVKNAYINITLSETNDSVILEIIDNAGGIKEENIHRIFDPYFTTKHKSIGTGLGLYISKMIIEKSMNGTLSVQNSEDGAKFIINMERVDE
jgi:signal transduction histidine kinase